MHNSQIGSEPSFSGGVTRLFEGPIAWLITLVVIPGLIAVALILPPINLLERLEAFTYTRVGPSGGVLSDPDGAMVNFPDEAVSATFLAALESTPRVDFINGDQVSRSIYEAARNLPNHLIPRSPFYEIAVQGSLPDAAVVTIPIPNDSMPYETLGVYNWDGESWQHIPSAVLAAEDLLEARLDFVPDSFMVMQTAPAIPEVTADLGLAQALPERAIVTYDARAGLYLRGDGALDGAAPGNTGNTLPIIRNWEGQTVRTDLINNLLLDPGQQENQLVAVEETVIGNGYPGVVIDYRGIDALPSARADFVRLMTEMAARLHAADKTLAIQVELPRQISADTWDTGGYDWFALSQVADTLVVPSPVDPRAFEAGGEMDALLSWATGLVERRKLRFLLSTQSIERAGNYMLLKGYRESLEPLVSQVAAQTAEGSSELTVTLDNPRIFSQVAWNDTSNGYSYSYIDDQGFERTVFIENAGSLTSKLNLLASYNIRDVSIRVPESGDVDENIWDILLQFQQGADLVAEMGQHSVSYTVYDSSGNVIGQDIRPLEAPAARFQQVSNDGAVRVEAQILGANGQPVTANYATETEVASSLSAAAKEDIATAAAETDVARAESEAEGIVAAASNDGTPRVTTSQVLNVREGPSTAHTILGQTGTGDNYSVVAKNEAGDWWQVEYNGGIGWVFGQLVSASGAVDAVAVTTDFPEPPAIVEAPAAGGGAAAPVVAAPAPSGAVPFGYGVQAHMVDNGQAGQVMSVTQGMGFNWVKQQIEWKRFEADQGNIAWGGMDEMINAANNAGISLLFSVVNAPAWARESGFDGSVGGPPADPQTFANFNGAIAGKYCGSSLKMMEIWNEQNLHYEWGNKPLNAGEYVALLAPSYAAVKAACPQMVVVSGALTPAGNNPGFAVDDFTYLEEMFKAGAANYFDALGAHPSGYNVPPDSTWEQACEAIVANGNSFNGACDSPHHSWSFRSTMEGYRNIMSVYGAGDRVIVPSEFGWAAGGALDPRYKYADDNDYQEQAQWTVRAYQMMREWGWVGPAFLWNLNFRVVANGTEKAQWGIVDPGWGPLPVYNALASMPK